MNFKFVSFTSFYMKFFYLISSLAFLFLGGALALAIRLELFLPGAQFIADSMTFNRIFTVHGTTLIFLFIIPFASAVGNYYVPIMVRYKDMAYPKLNAIAFWMIPPSGALIWLGFADFTWYATPPYSIISAPGPAADMWIFDTSYQLPELPKRIPLDGM